MEETNTKNSLLAEFRQKIIGEFIKKGIKPPDPDSQQEKELFDKWVKTLISRGKC